MDQTQIPMLPPPGPLQFGLKTILAITAAFSALFAAGAWFGVPGVIAFLLLAAVGSILFNQQMRLPDKIVSGAVLLLLTGFFLPVIQKPRGPNRGSPCRNNLKQIGLGLQNYGDVYHCFPPAYLTDKNGKPMHSWRVLILPFIEQKALYDRYDFNEPWDGPHNSLLAKEMPAVFRCPSDTTNNGATTNYVAIVGPETVWPGSRGVTADEIQDGTSLTIAVVEVTGPGINWMEPRDLPFAAISNGINPKQGVGISSRHPGAAIVCFADGHVQTLSETISIETLKALCTKAGGEIIEDDF